ncbi:MAG: hypothetical protein ACO1SX_04750, partial [Actinomycetota bacterium]
MRKLGGWFLVGSALAVVGVSGVSYAQAPEVNLGAIPRMIAKEPTYQTPKQQYCLLVLGAAAKSRVWLVLDGPALYVDRNRNGVLTDPGERVTGVEGRFKVGELVEADGKSRYTNVVVAVDQRHGTEEEGITVKPFEVIAKVRGQFEMGAEPAFADSAAAAPIVHFGGPLSMRVFDPRQVSRGQRVAFRCLIRTPGLGEGSEAGLYHYGLPDYVYPVVSMEFPTAGAAAPARFELKTRCCQRLFLGSVTVPATAVAGPAKVTLSFSDWKDGG